LPSPSQRASGVASPFEQAAGAQTTFDPMNPAQAVRDSPSHTVVRHSSPAGDAPHASRSPRGTPVTGMQFPGSLSSAQASH
jgi:hypothetical protein